MAPNLFNSSNREASAVKYFEIRLDESNIILRGGEHEAASAVLKGTLVLCLAEPLRIQGIRLRFTGEKRIAWYHNASGPTQNKSLEEFKRETWDFKRHPETLPAGNYEWPFDMIIPGSTRESLEGLPDSWVIYRLKATIERGLLQQNCLARRQVRIIRTLDPASLELVHAMSVENIWPNKIEYSLSTASKAVIFGSTIKVDFKIIPLLKGLKIGNITTELLQKQSLTLRTSRTNSRYNSFSRIVAIDEFQLPEDAEPEDVEGQDGFLFSRLIQVPQTLKKCVQSFDGTDIKIKHHLAFNVQLKNPDGHISELHANLPVFIFLSPHLPIDDHHNITNGSDHRLAIASSELTELTPPQYGEHELDILYNDIDPSGYMTPTGTSTPFGARSSSVSADNLASLNSIDSTGFAASVLQSRLNNLEARASPRTGREDRSSRLSSSYEQTTDMVISGGTSPLRDRSSPPTGQIMSRGSSSPARTPAEGLSRQPSEEDAAPTGSEHVEYSAEDLAKVPSYTTALQSVPRVSMNVGLPTYQAAIRSTPSPPTMPITVPPA